MVAPAKPNPEQLLLDDLLAAQLQPTPQHKFHEYRKWAFDFAWPSLMLAVEVNGRGRHQQVKGEREDRNKINCATEMGWRVLEYPAGSVRIDKRRARIVEQIRRIICGVCDPDDAAIVLSGD